MKLGPKEIKVVNEYFVRPVKNRLKEIFMKKGLPQLRTVDEIKQPPVRKDVEDIQAINEFNKRNPRADGGRIGYALGSTDNPIVPQNNLMDMSLEESTTGPGGFPMTAGVSVLPKLYDTVPKAINLIESGATTAAKAKKILTDFFKQREPYGGATKVGESTPKDFTPEKNFLSVLKISICLTLFKFFL